MLHTVDDLKQLQALPLDIKIKMSKNRIREWIREWGESGVYVSFSGGKDSTVLLDLVRSEYPNIEGVFIDTGLEYPEIRDFVKQFDNITWIKPKLNFKQIITKYGYPIISKEVAHKVGCVQKNPDTSTYRVLFDRNNKSKFNVSKYAFLLEAPFRLEHKCCDFMKKNPAHDYEKKTGKKRITGTLACESSLRQRIWLENGCNAFDIDRPSSNPLSFWTEQDILKYIHDRKLPICSVYGDVVPTKQMCMFDEDMEYETTGCNRTGCVFCLFGIHLEKHPNRLEQLKISHPQLYDYIMKPWNDGGLDYKNILDWINAHSNLDIKY